MDPTERTRWKSKAMNNNNKNRIQLRKNSTCVCLCCLWLWVLRRKYPLPYRSRAHRINFSNSNISISKLFFNNNKHKLAKGLFLSLGISVVSFFIRSYVRNTTGRFYYIYVKCISPHVKWLYNISAHVKRTNT